MAKLVGRTGAVAGQDFVLSESVRLGAASDNDIRIAVEGVSRRHARVFREGDRFWVEDTGATNGTFVNGGRIQRETLRHLDILTLGRSVDLIFLSRDDDPPPAPEVDQLIDVKLEIIDGAEAGTIVDVPRGEITVGRAPSCNVVLNSPTVGRAHARIERGAKRLLIQDLQSANGTFVNGKSIDGTARLASGDLVSLGGVRSLIVRIKGNPSLQPGIVETPTHGHGASQDWKTRFMWGPEELAQIERARAEAIARVKMQEAESVPAKAAPVAATLAGLAAPAGKPAAATLVGPVAPAVKAGGAAPAPAAPAVKAPPAAAKVDAPAPAHVVAPKPPAPAPVLPEAPEAPKPASAPAAATASPPPQHDPPPTSAPSVQPGEESVRVSEAQTIRVPAPARRIRGITLIGTTGQVVLGLGTFKIGRGLDADLRLDDRQVSRAHASLVVDEQSAAIEDLTTVNRTLLNGHEIKGREPLESGDVVRFGHSEFTIQLMTSSEREP